MPSQEEARAYVEERSIPEPNTGCWLWLARVNQHGYGLTGHKGKAKWAHRFSYEAYKGPILVGLQIDHLCRVTCCVNPTHMEPVTGRVNTLRGYGPTAQNARKDVCGRGHKFSVENTHHRKTRHGTQRQCRTCRRQLLLKHRQTGQRLFCTCGRLVPKAMIRCRVGYGCRAAEAPRKRCACGNLAPRLMNSCRVGKGCRRAKNPRAALASYAQWLAKERE